MSDREHTTIETVLIQRVKSLEEGLAEARAKLIEYATEDSISGGYGSGCFARPDDFIAPTVAKINALIGDPD